jgi:beta-lactamase regulating signal transducer with metallopeptidase domain
MILPVVLLFSLLAAGLVWLAGRKDDARDPRLTLWVLLLLAGFPLLSVLPKVEVEGLPADPAVFTRWLPWIWAAGALLFSLRLVVALAQLIRWRHRSTPVTDPGYAIHRPEIRVLPGLQGPIATGVFRPLILVPETWNQWPPSLKQTVIAHETAHHQRHDPLWRAVAAITCTLHWFNPLVWWMSSRLADQCEYACDERVVEEGIQPGDYARNLCDAASVCRAPATTLAMAHRPGLESRIRRMMSAPGVVSRRAPILAITAACTCAAGLAMVERKPSDWIPAIPADEIQTRLRANPFPADSAE